MYAKKRALGELERAGSTGGFTLIELAVVLAVVAILATVVVPDFIEVNRNDLAEKAAMDTMQLMDSAKWYFTNSSRWTPYDPARGDQGNDLYDPDQSRWPGDMNRDWSEDLPRAAEDCLLGNGPEAFGGVGGVGLRCHIPRITLSDLENPWEQDYDLEVIPVPGNPDASGFVVMTNVPQSAAAVYRSLVPGGWCSNEGSFGSLSCPSDLPPPGFVTCCALIPEPGNEASYQAMVAEQSHANPDCRDAPRDAQSRAYCNPDETLRGVNCSGKDCSNMRAQCCRLN